ncbi:hypothetical protein C0992_005114, partial [Termitomyces sp. T32_za158]
TNRLQCLRLTNRCADILLSVREEIKYAGDQVNEELQAPIAKLKEYVFLILYTRSSAMLYLDIPHPCLHHPQMSIPLSDTDTPSTDHTNPSSSNRPTGTSSATKSKQRSARATGASQKHSSCSGSASKSASCATSMGLCRFRT